MCADLQLFRWVNTLRPRQNGRNFADDIFKCIFLNENVWISLNISLKFVPKVPIYNIPALVQIMAWRRSCDKPLSEPMTVSLLTHICVTRPQWVNTASIKYLYSKTSILHVTTRFLWYLGSVLRRYGDYVNFKLTPTHFWFGQRPVESYATMD